MEYKDYYATLGVSRDAAKDEIQKAYRKLARKYHPDVNTSPEAEARFKEIGEAYEVLKDPEKKAKYDRYGSAWKAAQRGGAPPPGFEEFFDGVRFDFGDGGGFGVGDSGFSSFFEMLFGGGPGGVRATRVEWPQGGLDHEATLVLSLDEAASGGKREIAVTDPATGQRKTYTLNVPAGVRPGGRIRLRGRGGEGRPGGQRGDLYLKIDLLPHPHFRLDGHDLRTSLEVTPWEAALGGQLPVDTLNGRVSVKIPAGTSSGRTIRLRGKGFPRPEGGCGDLLAEVRIVVPERLTDAERRLFEQLARTSDFRPAGRTA